MKAFFDIAVNLQALFSKSFFSVVILLFTRSVQSLRDKTVQKFLKNIKNRTLRYVTLRHLTSRYVTLRVSPSPSSRKQVYTLILLLKDCF